MIFIYEANTANSKGVVTGFVTGIVSTDFGTLDEELKGGHLETLIQKHIDNKMTDIAGIILKDVRKICD